MKEIDATLTKKRNFFFKIYLFIYLFSITKYLFTILTYKQYMVLTLLTKTILYLQNNTDWFTVWDTYATNSTILYLQYDLHTLQKPEKKGGVW